MLMTAEINNVVKWIDTILLLFINLDLVTCFNLLACALFLATCIINFDFMFQLITI